MKIYIRYPLKKEYIEKILSSGTNVEITENIEEAEIFFGWGLSKDEFKKAKNLKWIQLTSAGVDHMLYDDIINSEVILTSASGVHPKPIAEHVFGLILSWTRRIDVAIKGKIEKRWNKDEIEWCDELTGKTMGIIGYGNIGQEIGRIAKCFDMKVIGLKKKKENVKIQPYELLTFQDLDKLLKDSDIIVTVLPHTKETENFISEEEFKKMKHNVIFVNVGRGRTVDEKALIKALKEGKIQCALLDVFYDEPLPDDSPLWDMENVIITPHIAGMTPYYDERVVEIFLKNLKEYPNFERMINVVDKEAGY